MVRDCTILDIASAVQTPEQVVLEPVVIRRERVLAAPRDYLAALTGLRFWLAVWVILHHICGKGMMLESWCNSLPSPAARLIHSGYLAVQTFFILSGFVLARTYAHAKWNRRSLGRFFTARFARIYPIYLASLVIVSPFIIEMMISPDWTPAHRAGILTNYLLVLQGWTGSLGVGWNTPAWTLSCEFFFYLCFPLLFVALRNAGWRAISIAMTLALVWPTVLDHAGVPWQWKPVYHLADFVAGIAAARIFVLVERNDLWHQRGYWLYVPAALFGMWLMIHPTVAEGPWTDLNEFLRPINVALLIGFALSGGWIAKWLSSGVSDFLGKASYSMYVLHVPILWWTGRYFVHGKMHPPLPLGATIYLLLVVLASSLVYQWLETPASVWIRTQQKRFER